MRRIFAVLMFLIALQVSAQQPVTTVPFKLFGDHIFIALSVDGSEPVDFIFDTGDGLAVIDLDVARNLGLQLNNQATKTSAQGSISGALIEHNKIEINKVKVDDVELYSTDLSHLEQSIGRNIDGIIGYDLLKNFVVSIDYDAMEVRLYNPNNFQYKGDGKRYAFKLDSYIPHITCQVTLNNGEVIQDEFFINTGAGTTMDFNTRFATKNGVIAKTGEHYSYPVSGLGDDETQHFEGRVQNFSVGGSTFKNMPIGISQAEHGIQHHKKIAGIMGNGLLKRFNMTLDYKTSSIYLEPNQLAAEPFQVNASGIHLQLDKSGKKVLVHRVFDGSPAGNAGIKVNAQLLEVNGQSVADSSLPELRTLLKTAGKQVRLKILQDGAEQTVELDLTPLI